MAPIHVRFSPGFLQEQNSRGAISSELTTWGKTGFSRSKLLQRRARSTPEHSSPDCEPAGAASAENSPRRGAPPEF
jgi:hypothetical protein